MILTATSKRELVALAVGAEPDGDGEASMLFCGLLFLKAGRKSSRLTLRCTDTKERYRVVLPKHLLKRDVDVSIKNIELELIENGP